MSHDMYHDVHESSATAYGFIPQFALCSLSLLWELTLYLLLVFALPGRSDTPSVDLWEAPRVVVQQFFPRPYGSQSAERVES